MAEEAQPRIQEKPAAHKSKVRRWAFAAVGIIMIILTVNFIVYQYKRANGTAGSHKEEVKAKPTTSMQGRDQFSDLVTQREQQEAKKQPSDFAHQVDSVATGAKTSGEQAWNNFMEKKNGGKEKPPAQPEISDEDKAVQKFLVEERIRALKSATGDWGLANAYQQAERAKAGSKATVASNDKTFNQSPDEHLGAARKLLDSPMPTDGTLEQRRAEVRRRIEAAQKLRASLSASAQAAGTDIPGGNADIAEERQELASVKHQFSEPPKDVVGYTQENAYNADVEGKMILPVGTEIPAEFTRKGISDFQGSQLKGIVSRDVYDVSRQYILVPKGSEIIMRVMKAGNVNEAIQHRMGITVNWLVLPNGKKVDLSKSAGLDREGVGAIADKVDYHFMAQFLGVAAYAIVGSSSSYSGSGTSEDATFAGDVGEQSRKQASNIASKYLNIVPTITIRPGQSFYVSLEDELYIEPWKNIYESYYN